MQYMCVAWAEGYTKATRELHLGSLPLLSTMDERFEIVILSILF